MYICTIIYLSIDKRSRREYDEVRIANNILIETHYFENENSES